MEKGNGQNNAVETAAIAASTLERPRCDLVKSTVNYICTKTNSRWTLPSVIIWFHNTFTVYLAGKDVNFPK
jgi:hypothetical protein